MSYASDALIDVQGREIEKLKTENAKLIVKLNAEHIARQNVEVDNAKLRELVNDMWICIAHGSEGWDCTGCRRDPDNVCIMGISEFSDRMRELGIEVRHV